MWCSRAAIGEVLSEDKKNFSEEVKVSLFPPWKCFQIGPAPPNSTGHLTTHPASQALLPQSSLPRVYSRQSNHTWWATLEGKRRKPARGWWWIKSVHENSSLFSNLQGINKSSTKQTKSQFSYNLILSWTLEMLTLKEERWVEQKFQYRNKHKKPRHVPPIFSSTAININESNPKDHIDKKGKIITMLKQLRGPEYTPRKQKQRPEGNINVNQRYENGIK